MSFIGCLWTTFCWVFLISKNSHLTGRYSWKPSTETLMISLLYGFYIFMHFYIYIHQNQAAMCHGRLDFCRCSFHWQKTRHLHPGRKNTLQTYGPLLPSSALCCSSFFLYVMLCYSLSMDRNLCNYRHSSKQLLVKIALKRPQNNLSSHVNNV